jgi:hypothetical protein
MGFSEKMTNIADGMKTGAKSGAMKTTTTLLRLITGFLLGLTLALVGQEVAKYGNLSLMFVTLVVFFAFMRLTKSWSLGHLLVFDLVVVLVAQLLRMYILLAP